MPCYSLHYLLLPPLPPLPLPMPCHPPIHPQNLPTSCAQFVDRQLPVYRGPKPANASQP